MGAIPWAPQFGNGDTEAKALMIDVDGLGHYLQPSAARSFRAYGAEYRSVFGIELTISEAFRDIPTQDYFYDQYRYHGGNVAALPGTSSHGQGLAVDINSWVYGNSSNTDRHRWLVANAPRYSWSWELVGQPSGEPWHFNYVGGYDDWPDTNPNASEEDDMPYPRLSKLRATADGSEATTVYYYDFGPGVGVLPIDSPDHQVLLDRYAAGGHDKMFQNEIDIVNWYLRGKQGPRP